jgi:acetyl esterase/lipase
MLRALQRLAARSLRWLPDAWVLRCVAGAPIAIGGRTLDPRLQLIARRAAAKTPLHRLSPQEARQRSAAALAALDGRPRPMQDIDHRVVPGAAGELPARVYRPAGINGPRPLLLYFHQGGCVIGDLDCCETFCTVLAETARCPVMSIGYRLGPEHRFPAAQRDAIAAFLWATEHAGEVGGDPKRVAVGGDAAGGTLAAVVTQEMKRRGGPLPCFQLLIYPQLLAYADNEAYRDFADTHPLTPEGVRWYLSHYLGGEEEWSDPLASPLLEPDVAGLAPTLLVTAGFDPLCDEGAAYAQRLEAAGVPVVYRCYEHLCHGFTAMSGAVPAAGDALQEIAWDFERALTRDGVPRGG